MDTLRQDVRHALRRLIRNPGFSLVAALTLALGIGANTAIFSVVYGVLLKPLPYHEPERLVALYHLSDGHRSMMSGPNFTDLRNSVQSLEDAAALHGYRTILTGRGEPVRLDAAAVSASLFDLLGVRPLLGRTFRAEDNQPGRTDVVVLAHGTWQQLFGGDLGVIGTSVTLDGAAREIVGIMPPEFSYPAERALWIPTEHTQDFLSIQRAAWFLSAVGRVRPGLTLEQVSAEVQTIGRQLAKQYPDENEGVDLVAVPLHEAMVGDIRTAVLVLFGAVGFVLLIASANVANLLLARAAAREGEMAVRTALGAARSRLIRQLLTESLLLSVVGGGLGLLLAVWGVESLIRLQPEGIPRLGDVSVETIVILFTLAVSVVTGIVFGLVPAFQSTRTGLAHSLKEGGRGALTSRGGSRIRGALVIAEMAIAVMLLAGAGLLVRSFTKLAAVDPGFRVAQALTFELSLPEARYPGEAQQVSFYEQLMQRLGAIPGVRHAGAALALPLTGTSIVLSFEVAGRPSVPASQQPAMQVRVATPGYFRTIGIPLKHGRLFDDRDREGAPQVVLLTESAVRQYFPDEDPVGKTVTLGWGRGEGRPNAGGEVVGIIGDVKDAGMAEPEAPQIFLPHAQVPVRSMSVVLDTAVPPASIADTVRREVYAVDPSLPVANVRTLEQLVARSISQPRFYTMLLSAFAGLALLLAAIGIFGVLSYAVAQRTREIGIRMALGAQERSLRRLVVRQAMLLAAGGVVIGMAAAYFVSKTLTSLLFDTTPGDPLTFALVPAVLLAVSLLASYVPARRATRVDPIVALRTE